MWQSFLRFRISVLANSLQCKSVSLHVCMHTLSLQPLHTSMYTWTVPCIRSSKFFDTHWVPSTWSVSISYEFVASSVFFPLLVCVHLWQRKWLRCTCFIRYGSSIFLSIWHSLTESDLSSGSHPVNTGVRKAEAEHRNSSDDTQTNKYSRHAPKLQRSFSVMTPGKKNYIFETMQTGEMSSKAVQFLSLSLSLSLSPSLSHFASNSNLK
jgi:hypothetical protein